MLKANRIYPPRLNGQRVANSAINQFLQWLGGDNQMKSKLTAHGLRLLASGSLLAIAVPGIALAQAAQGATEAPEAEEPTNEAIIVTGTRIRGVAAVGSSTIPVDRATIQERATGSTNDILRDVPQITNFGASGTAVGGPQVQNSSLNNTYANSINLRGLGTTATLTLVDGHRVAPSGGGGGYTDSDLVPAIALERIEVVADGASAIYGSDAVAGVVNLRLREPFTIAWTSRRPGRYIGRSRT
jgi:iron complex outermembrane recepter protein